MHVDTPTTPAKAVYDSTNAVCDTARLPAALLTVVCVRACQDLSGFVGLNGPGGKRLTVILNPGIDVSNLRSLKALDDTRGNVVLLNCGVERMTFFDKVGLGDYLDGFKPAYSLKRAATGFIFRAYPSAWQLHVVQNGKMSLIDSTDKRPSFMEAEKKIKAFR